METFLHHYVEILSDPAHLAVEVTLMVLVDFVFLGDILPFVKRAVRRHDSEVHDVGREPFVPPVTTALMHMDFDWRALTVTCPVAGPGTGVTKTFNRCEGCGSFVASAPPPPHLNHPAPCGSIQCAECYPSLGNYQKKDY